MAPPPTLSQLLRERTAEVHRRAERTGFVEQLLAGELPARAYVTYLGHLRGWYAALEAALRAHARHPVVAGVADPRLDRTDALDRDLAFWAGRCGVDATDSVPETTAFEALADLPPHLLVAHHYTRYLGDLSGGQVIATALRRHHDLTDDGLAFYGFPGIDKVERYRRDYRVALDRLPLTARQRAEVAAEAVVAFAASIDVFERSLAVAAGVPAH